jgi:sugar/nucleoside kinase (ribokinase family)
MTLHVPLNLRNRSLVAGVGSALVDVLLQENDDFLAKAGAQKGGMTLADISKITTTLKMTSHKPAIVSGGSACNTIVGAGRLGGPARFIGKCGKDDFGELLVRDLKKNNVEPVLFKSDSPTGRVLSIITPDAQRSMFTFLGASSETKPQEIVQAHFDDASIVHIEGYLLFNESLILTALETAKGAGALISLDLASFTVVEASKKILGMIIRDYVNIVIANEDEAFAYTGEKDEEKALAILAQEAEIAVVKIGKRGSMIAHDGERIRIGIIGDGKAVDTTGAGDLWASGFLYGLAHGYTLEQAGKLGAACGAEVCKVIGAHISDEGWQRIKGVMKK